MGEKGKILEHCHGRIQTNRRRWKAVRKSSMDAKIGESLVRNKIATYSPSINCKKKNSNLANTLTKKTKQTPPVGQHQQSDICFIRCICLAASLRSLNLTRNKNEGHSKNNLQDCTNLKSKKRESLRNQSRFKETNVTETKYNVCNWAGPWTRKEKLLSNTLLENWKKNPKIGTVDWITVCYQCK